MDNESFFKMPKVLFTDEYKDLSAEAKLLYGLMLDRMQLSAINGWCDKNGEVFIFYTIAETSEMLGCGHDKATRLQRELEKHNLLRRKYQGKGKPAINLAFSCSLRMGELDNMATVKVRVPSELILYSVITHQNLK